MTVMVDLADIKPKIINNYEQRVIKCIEDTRKECPTDFFVIAQHKPVRRGQERGLITNIKPCFAMPTPTFDTTLYHYIHAADDLKLIWTLPAEEYALNLYHNRHQVAPEDYSLLDYVLKYFDGTLFNIVDEWEQQHERYIREQRNAKPAKPRNGADTSN